MEDPPEVDEAVEVEGVKPEEGRRDVE